MKLGLPSKMESLDPIPSADYASITLLPANGAAENDAVENTHPVSVRNKHTAIKSAQEHIYAQVIQTTSSQEATCHQSKRSEHRKRDTDKILLHKTYVLRNSSLASNHSNSVPDVRKPNTKLGSVCPNNYGSLNVTKVHSKSVTNATDLTEDSTVFSISGRRVVVAHGFNGNRNMKNAEDRAKDRDAKDRDTDVIELKEIPNLRSSTPPTDNQVETKRRKLQVCTECCSLCLFVPGSILCILSPWLLVPIYVIPNFSGGHFQILIWITCISSAILVFMGCMMGNVVWYRKEQDWKWLLHCGRGPKDHYWGDALTSKRTTHTV